ncbi:NAD-dependent epimerase/dehydratase family protein [Streptomyces sp. TRM64462]|uniref:NAD-dependent epimerase/dehydratase family protein n=1 Tax=Streptomyces sp. TRM64462 TaxID=2741726 RepID=UPI001586ECD5|nr:NAD-dependent epimerase/dehydratase family protein [Streptomyces sp. TRM64462]
MRLLILGGTEFVGRAVAAEGLARGWDVTVFHRGRHQPPPGVKALHGDRTVVPDGLAALHDSAEEWDVVVDTWSAAPTAVRDTATLLEERAGRYVYVSSRSVYAWPPVPEMREDGPLVEAAQDDWSDVPYAQAKRGGELAAASVFGPTRTLLARAGLILGPWENIGRLPWWLNRVARGGPVLAPGPRDLPLQYIDVRDLAGWLLDAAEAGLSGPYDLVSPPGHTTMQELLEACVRATGSDAELRWTEPRKILDAGIEPWTDLPVWLPPGDLHDAMHGADVTKALEAGLRCRPVAGTVTDTWAWLTALGGRAPHRPDRTPVGLSPDVEAKVLGGGDD